MPLTAIDPNTALVVIDLQKGIASFPTFRPLGEVIDRSATLARAFRERGLPVVLVNVTGIAPGRTDEGVRNFSFPDGWADLVPELEQAPTDIPVSKERWGAFLGTQLDAVLRERGVTQVVVIGVATSIGVESTARSAYDLGYNVTLIVDAMTDMKADAHDYSVASIFPRLGETGTTEEMLALLR
jgi:nicotinamidase-related amidase